MGLFSGRKGSLDLTVTNRAYNAGEDIPISVHLTTKKDLGPGRLFASLVCTETTWRRVTERRADGSTTSRNKSETTVIFRHEVDLAIEASFPDNTDQVFTTNLPLPALPAETVPEMPDAPGWVGTLVDVASALSDARRETKWFVEARYDIPRLDLKDKQDISVNI